MSNGDCDAVRELAAELALGIAGGEERARAIEHAAGCAACRRELDELASAADELLLLTPEHEPPPGFETRVIERMGAGSRRPRRLRRTRPLALAVAAAVVAALVTAIVVSARFGDDHRVASEYRATLAANNGTYFEAQRLRGPDGRSVGQVFGYQGSPSWLLVILHAGRSEPGRYRAEVVTRDGRRLRVRTFRVGRDGASWGQALPARLDDVARVRIVGGPHAALLQTALEVPEDHRP